MWKIHVQSPTNLPKCMWKLVFNVAEVIFWFGSPKKKPIKSKGMMSYLKLFKRMLLGLFFEKQTKIATHMDLWKYGQILTIQKSLIIKHLKFSRKRFFIWIYHLVLHYILSSNNKFGMSINMIFSILWCSNQTTSPYFSISKVHYY
jgi:hypothetical protein